MRHVIVPGTATPRAHADSLHDARGQCVGGMGRAQTRQLAQRIGTAVQRGPLERLPVGIYRLQ